MTEYVRHNIIDTTGYQRPVTVPISMSETLTLRDQFAMAALPGLIADPDSIAFPIGHAKLAYQYADAMLEARKEKK
jgi:hypothetical protein